MVHKTHGQAPLYYAQPQHITSLLSESKNYAPATTIAPRCATCNGVYVPYTTTTSICTTTTSAVAAPDCGSVDSCALTKSGATISQAAIISISVVCGVLVIAVIIAIALLFGRRLRRREGRSAQARGHIQPDVGGGGSAPSVGPKSTKGRNLKGRGSRSRGTSVREEPRTRVMDWQNGKDRRARLDQMRARMAGFPRGSPMLGPGQMQPELDNGHLAANYRENFPGPYPNQGPPGFVPPDYENAYPGPGDPDYPGLYPEQPEYGYGNPYVGPGEPPFNPYDEAHLPAHGRPPHQNFPNREPSERQFPAINRRNSRGTNGGNPPRNVAQAPEGTRPDRQEPFEALSGSRRAKIFGNRFEATQMQPVAQDDPISPRQGVQQQPNTGAPFSTPPRSQRGGRPPGLFSRPHSRFGLAQAFPNVPQRGRGNSQGSGGNGWGGDMPPDLRSEGLGDGPPGYTHPSGASSMRGRDAPVEQGNAGTGRDEAAPGRTGSHTGPGNHD